MIIIDTSSLLSLVRYYLLFDRGVLFNFFKQQIEKKEILVLAEVQEECGYMGKGIVIEKLSFLSDKKLITKTDDLQPNKKFFNLLENQFCNKSQKKDLEENEIESEKNRYLNSADCKIILKALKALKVLKPTSKEQNITVVTEETSASNDKKLYKKIPVNCALLGIDCITLPQLLLDNKNKISITITANNKL